MESPNIPCLKLSIDGHGHIYEMVTWRSGSTQTWRLLRMNVFHFIVLSFAVYRLTVLVSRDACPFKVCAKLRTIDRLKVLKCPFCSSIWVSAVVNVAYYYACSRSETVILLGLIFAMSAITIILDRCFTSDYLAN